MDIEYRKLSVKELDVFINMRINQLREEGADEDIDLKPDLRDYYERHMAGGSFVSWIALDDDRIIGTSGIAFVEKPPYVGCPNGKIGLLSGIGHNIFSNKNTCIFCVKLTDGALLPHGASYDIEFNV